MLPRTFALAAQQINLIAVTAIASTLSIGFVAIFAYSQDIYYVPVGVVALPLSLAVFPSLSRFFAQHQLAEFKECLFSSLRKTLIFIVPLAVLMFVLRAQLVRLIFGTLGPGNFDWTATRLTAACVGVFSIAILAQGLLPLLSRAFFSWADTKTPTLITIATVALNIILCFTFVWLLHPGASNFLYSGLAAFLKLSEMENISIIGLALAFSLSSLFQLGLTLFFLNKKIKIFEKSLCQFLRAVLLASILAGFFAYITLYFLNNFVATNAVLGLSLQAAVAGLVGVAVYILLGFLLKLPELQSLKSNVINILSKKREP
jgi:putative peptidoglycan lipid II flippase